MNSQRICWVLATLALAGCGASADPPPVSPIVAPDSDAARRARAEDDARLAELQKQEARARKRVKDPG